MGILKRLPVGVACSYIFHRPGAAPPLSLGGGESLMLMGGMMGGLSRGDTAMQAPMEEEEQDYEEEEEDLEGAVEGFPGWYESVDPDGRIFYFQREVVYLEV